MAYTGEGMSHCLKNQFFHSNFHFKDTYYLTMAFFYEYIRVTNEYNTVMLKVEK